MEVNHNHLTIVNLEINHNHLLQLELLILKYHVEIGKNREESTKEIK